MIRSRGQVGDVGLADEWQQVVHAQRLKRDVANEHQLVVVTLVGERRRGELDRRHQLRERAGDPSRRPDEIRRVDIGADRPQQVGCSALGCLEVDFRGIDHPSRTRPRLADSRPPMLIGVQGTVVARPGRVCHRSRLRSPARVASSTSIRTP